MNQEIPRIPENLNSIKSDPSVPKTSQRKINKTYIVWIIILAILTVILSYYFTRRLDLKKVLKDNPNHDFLNSFDIDSLELYQKSFFFNINLTITIIIVIFAFVTCIAYKEAKTDKKANLAILLFSLFCVTFILLRISNDKEINIALIIVSLLFLICSLVNLYSINPFLCFMLIITFVAFSILIYYSYSKNYIWWKLFKENNIKII